MIQSKVIIFLSFASLLYSCKQERKDDRKKDKPTFVDVMIAKHKDVFNDVEVNGNVLAEEMVELHPEASGRLTYLNVPDGERVSKGTVLARVNDAELQAQLRQQEVQLELASKTEQRQRTLLEKNSISQADYDVALAQFNTLKASTQVIQAQLDKMVVRAPFDGKLGLRQVSEGAYVTPSIVIATLQQVDKLKIDFAVPDVYQDMVKVGAKVSIIAGDSTKQFSATIVAIEPQINTTTRNIKARARLISGNLTPGSFVKVVFSQKSSGIMVPSNAIIPDAVSNQVIVVKDGLAKFSNVETGIRTAGKVELVSGVDDGDSIVVAGVLFVRQKAKVTIKKIITE